MNAILLEESYIFEYIKDILHDAKIKMEEVSHAKYHHVTKYRDASSICKYGIKTIDDLKMLGIKNLSFELLESMKDTKSHANGTDSVSLAVVGLTDLYSGEEEYNPFDPNKVDFLISSDLKVRRYNANYGNEFLTFGSIDITKLRAIDIRLLELIKMYENGLLRNRDISKIIEKFNYISDIARAINENQLDILFREMSDSENFILEPKKLEAMPKLVLKK